MSTSLDLSPDAAEGLHWPEVRAWLQEMMDTAIADLNLHEDGLHLVVPDRRAMVSPGPAATR